MDEVFKKLHWALSSTESAISKNILVCLALSADTYDDNGNLISDIGIGELTVMSGLSERSCQSTLRLLEEQKLISIDYSKGRRNEYTIFCEDEDPNWFKKRYAELKLKSNRPKISEIDRWEVMERDNFECQICGERRFLQIDHIMPLAKGGPHHIDNFQTLCKKCNMAKSDK